MRAPVLFFVLLLSWLPAAPSATAMPATLNPPPPPGPPPPSSDFEWIASIENSGGGQRFELEPKTYLIDRQYQLPPGTELRGAGTTPGRRTVIKAVGRPYNACAGTASAPGMVQGRKGLLLGDGTYVSGLHHTVVGMEIERLQLQTARLDRYFE